MKENKKFIVEVYVETDTLKFDSLVLDDIISQHLEKGEKVIIVKEVAK